jgi:hypothetical protein
MNFEAFRRRVVRHEETYRILLLVRTCVDTHFERRFNDDNQESTIDRPRRKCETVGIGNFYASLNGSLPRDDQVSLLR